MDAVYGGFSLRTACHPVVFTALVSLFFIVVCIFVDSSLRATFRKPLLLSCLSYRQTSAQLSIKISNRGNTYVKNTVLNIIILFIPVFFRLCFTGSFHRFALVFERSHLPPLSLRPHSLKQQKLSSDSLFFCKLAEGHHPVFVSCTSSMMLACRVYRR